MTEPTDEIEHDLSYLDALSEQRVAASRAEVLKQAVRLTLAGGGACAMVLAGAALVASSVQVRIATTEHVVQAPPAQIVEVPKIVEAPASHEASTTPETHPFASLSDKTYAGRILSVTETDVCFTEPAWCTFPVRTDPSGKAVLDKDGEPIRNPDVVYAVSTMKAWIGHEAWLAPSPADPGRVARFWAKNGDELVSFTLERRSRAKETAL